MSDTVFSISIGGFFAGQNSLAIEKTPEGHRAKTDSFHLGDSSEGAFPVSDKQMEKLYDALDRFGVEDWYSDYFNPCVLDGVQWSVYDGIIEHSGSNFFPVGFKALSRFVAEEFDLPSFDPADDFEDDEPSLETELSIVASHHRSGEESDVLLHDLYALTNRHPEFKDYGAILEGHGVPLDVARIKTQDMRKADATLIVASMVVISRADHFDGYSDEFGTCVKDGTFEKWLERLDELALPGAWIS